MSLEIWTVYDHPSDYPMSFIARKFILDKPTGEIIIMDALNDLRDVFEEMGLFRMDRDINDDPVIVETWI